MRAGRHDDGARMSAGGLGAPGMGRAWAAVATCFLMLFMGAGPVYYAYGNFAVSFGEEFGA